jgi:hypothetical protein
MTHRITQESQLHHNSLTWINHKHRFLSFSRCLRHHSREIGAREFALAKQVDLGEKKTKKMWESAKSATKMIPHGILNDSQLVFTTQWSNATNPRAWSELPIWLSPLRFTRAAELFFLHRSGKIPVLTCWAPKNLTSRGETKNCHPSETRVCPNLLVLLSHIISYNDY